MTAPAAGSPGATPSRWSWGTTASLGRAGAVVAALHAVWLWPVLVGQGALFTRDILPFLIPFKAEAGRLLAAGHFPWLSPRLMGGMPLWAHPSAEIADPAVALFAVLSNPHAALGWMTLLHATVAGVGAAYLARCVGVRGGMEVWVALAYAGCGPVLSMWAIKSVPAVALPFVLAGGVQLARNRPGSRWLVALSVAGLLLHPDPPSVGSTALLAAVLCAVRAPRQQWKHRTVWLAVCGVLGALLCGMYLVPALEVVAASPRTAVTQWSAGSSLGLRWVELVAPGGLGVPGATGSLMGAFRKVTQQTPFVGSLYLGASVLAGLLLVRRRGLARTDVALLTSAVVLLVLAHGDAVPGAGALWTFVHARFPEKLLPPAYLCAILVAARALARHRRHAPGRAPAWVLLGMGGAGMLGADALARGLLGGVAEVLAHEVALLSGQLTLGLGMVALAGVALLLTTDRPQWRMPALIAVAVLDGTLCAAVTLLTTPIENLSEGNSVQQQLPAGTTSVACCQIPQLAELAPTATSPALPPHTAAVEQAQRLAPTFGVVHGLSYPVASDVGGFGPVQMGVAMVQELPALGTNGALNVLAAWGVHTAISVAPMESIPGVYRVDRQHQPALYMAPLAAEPLWFAAGQWQVHPSLHSAMIQLAQGLPHPAALMVEPHQPAPPALPPQPDLHAQVTVLAADATHATLSVHAAAPVMLVQTSALRDGWLAWVDGAPVPVYRTNALHMGVAVAAGQHRVAWEYRPPGAVAGVLVSLMGLAGLVLLGRGRSRLRRSAG